MGPRFEPVMVYQKRCAVGLDRKCSPTVVPSIPGSRLEWPVGQAVKTAASHAANGGSIPPRVTKFDLGQAADDMENKESKCESISHK